LLHAGQTAQVVAVEDVAELALGHLGSQHGAGHAPRQPGCHGVAGRRDGLGSGLRVAGTAQMPALLEGLQHRQRGGGGWQQQGQQQAEARQQMLPAGGASWGGCCRCHSQRHWAGWPGSG
jgi:hypothetical protein